MRSQLEQALVFALERGEFVLYYQPQVDARTGSIVGVESLIRWHNPKLGWVPPDTFIPVAEHVGLIKTIGEWVLETACKQLVEWNRENLGPIRMAVNVSPLQFILPGLDKGILRILEETGVRPGDLELEITESSLMHDMNSAVQLMQHIKSYGVELAIDDFGTGYSSLSSLRHFPIDRLKIDQSFTREIGVSDDTTEITLTILAMAKHLGMKVIAEGVETAEQAELLMKNGCDEFQGYLYGKPVTADEIGQMLRKTLQMRV
jgi:EAL domain-containing protein (putative c-di-GMP-specific phosphodiesterase class I)